ncbi:MAG: hypothetical protein EAX91_12390 [Candidatus Lokiarchaeota archaeon]|nr:hypothetical protein [Candidatus Lokiarchaeota archaeon]
MRFYNSQGLSLDNYYSTTLGCCGGNTQFIKAEKCGISPYKADETIYYICKHFALPGIATVFLLLPLMFYIIFNFSIRSLSYIFIILSLLLLLSVGRENIRGWKYKIKNDDGNQIIYQPGPYVCKREAEKYICKINEISKTHYKLGFVGDILKVNKFDLEFHPDIKCFFHDVDLIIGNLEGIITRLKCPILKQAHPRKILTQLKTVLNKDTMWLLSMGNNHSEDFNNYQFNRSLARIHRNPKFEAFGRKDVSFIQNQNKDINIFNATEWSNQKTWNYTSIYESPNREFQQITNLLDNNKFNILFPHWGFENEKYVRTRFQKDAKALLTGIPQNYSKYQDFLREKYHKMILPDPAHKWDFIFAHHPHVLQPILKISDNILDDDGEPVMNCKGKPIICNKLAVFSAGNFTSGANILRKKKHISGIIMKCEIGPLKEFDEKLAIGRMEWRRIKNHKIRINGVRTKRVCVDNQKYRTYNRSLFIVSIILLIIFLVMFFTNDLISFLSSL